jgi:putative ABC transport system ATP-binding protein
VVPARGVTVVAGPSGAGKTTLLRLCNRLERTTSGRVRFRGEDVADLDPLRLRRRVGMVFQRPTPFPGTVRDNLRVAVPALTEPEAGAVLGRVGLGAGHLDRPATELSGGEAQRVCLARALVLEPEVLLMDEPTSSLDPPARLGLERLGRELADGGVPVLWVTHDLAQMRRLADHLLVLAAGRIEYVGAPGTLDAGASPAVRAFLASGPEGGEVAP